MYPISENAYRLLTSGASQKAIVTVYQTDGESFTLTDADICAGGLSVDRYSTSGQTLEIGSAVSSELSLTLKNDGKLNEKRLQGAELFIQVGVLDTLAPRAITTENGLKITTEQGNSLEIEEFNRLPEDISYSTTYVPLGWFKVDNSPRALSTIQISALDRMMRFDKDVKKGDLFFPCTVSELLLRICNVCDVRLANYDVSNLTNADYVILDCPKQENLTYRTLLIWIAQTTGTCAYMDYDGYLRLEWYNKNDNDDNAKSVPVDESMRYSSDLQEQFITITGLEIKQGEKVYQNDGYNDSYVISIKDNYLIQHDIQKIANTLGNKIVGFKYIPFKATTMPIPFLFPLDRIDFIKNGVHHETFVTNVNYTMNGSTAISAKGETKEINRLKNPTPFSPSQSTVIEKINQNVSDTQANLTTQEKATLHLNQTAASAMGLYYTEVSDGNGGTIKYWHDNAVLEDSNYISMQNSNGSFSTNSGWNNGNPTWTQGIDKFGNAICSLLNIIGIQAEWIDADSITTDKLSIGQVERGTNLIPDSSFESTNPYKDVVLGETGFEEYEHNAYWNIAEFTTSAEIYDPEPTAGVAGHIPFCNDNEGFDGNKAQTDMFLPPLLSENDTGAYGFETRNPIPISISTHKLSFYYRLHPNPISEVQTDKIENCNIIVKIQWLDENKNQITQNGVSCYSYETQSSQSKKWKRWYSEDIVPPLNTAYAKLLIGAKCMATDGITEDSVYTTRAYFDLDGILFEQGVTLNDWTCSESEVTNTGVIINSKGLNIADGKINVLCSYGNKNKVFFTDGNQILQFIGGTESQKYDIVTGDVSAKMKSEPARYVGDGLANDFLGYKYITIDENGKEEPLARFGIHFPVDSSENGGVNQHSPLDKTRPFTFDNPNGFMFNGEYPLISDAQYGNNLDVITSPGWYYGKEPISEKLKPYPIEGEYILMVEKSDTKVFQTLTDASLRRMFKRYCTSGTFPIDWSGWVSYSADNRAKDINNNTEIAFSSNIGTLSAGTYIQNDEANISIVSPTDPYNSYTYPEKRNGLLEVFKGASWTFQRYTTIDGRVYVRYTGTENPTFNSDQWSAWSQI